MTNMTPERLADIRAYHAEHPARRLDDGVGCHGCQLLAELDALTQENARLTAERDDARGERDAYFKSYTECWKERDRLTAQVAALREALMELQDAVYRIQNDWSETRTGWALEKAERVLAETAPPGKDTLNAS